MTPADFRWINWNIDSATKHGCTIEEIEWLALHPPRGFPRRVGGKGGRPSWLVQGRGQGDRIIEVLYTMDANGKTAFVFHAMPLTTRRRRGGRCVGAEVGYWRDL